MPALRQQSDFKPSAVPGNRDVEQLRRNALFHLFAPYDLLVFELRAKRCQCKAMPLLCLVNVIYNLLAALLHLFPADLNLFAPHEHGLIALCYQNG